ncbi:MAG: ABC transporter permease [Spirochaetales bacterium]|nr:ABC transporter permease [Spirochaetales bacterium]
MGVLLKIVYRNLKEHKVKSLIIGIIIAFGMYILIVGNSIIDTVTAGISKNFVEYNTGHVVVFPSNLENPSLVGGPQEMMENKVVPIIRDYRSVVEVVTSNPKVTAVSPQINGMATMQFGEEGSGFAQLLAVDPGLYVKFFPDNIVLQKGRFLSPGEEGIVLSASAVEMLEESSAETVDIGDPVILTGTTLTAGMKIREVPVVGIYDVTVASQMMTSYLDVENMRVLNGMTQITDLEAVLTKDEQSGLGSVDEDSLFGAEDSFIQEDAPVTSESDRPIASAGDSSDRELYNAVNPDAWHYLLIRLEDESQIRKVVRELNGEFTARDMDVTAYRWIEAAGQVAEMTAALRLVFNVIIIIIAVVAVIIIMNTLVISVTERIGEIGTMRAIGAQKSFVRRMIILETVVISLFFGGLGILLGSLTIGIVGAARIETQSLILQMLAGGSVIRPVISAGSIIVSLIGMLAAGVIASVYPAQLALRIEPRQAMDTH